MAWLVMIASFIYFIVPSLLYYFTFYIDRFGTILGLIIGSIFSEVLYPFHFIVVGFSGGNAFDAFVITYVKTAIGAFIIWFSSLFLD